MKEKVVISKSWRKFPAMALNLFRIFILLAKVLIKVQRVVAHFELNPNRWHDSARFFKDKWCKMQFYNA